ncbi:MAG: hypothetical protein SF052_05945 [Bacteroidia bacterium]|nr:hypothetical protein [Bacteroidia bacterium]
MDIIGIYKSALGQKVTAEAEIFLDEIIQKYPYFSLPRLLKAVAKPEKDNIFAASAYSVNRRQLKQLLEGELFLSETLATMDIEPPVLIFPDIEKPGSVHDLFSIVDFGSGIHFPLSVRQDFSIDEGISKGTTDSFLDWDIKIRTLKTRNILSTIRREIKQFKNTTTSPPTTTATASISKKSNSQELIDAFLKNQSTLRRKNTADTSPVAPARTAVNSIREDENLVTETMARLHLLQNNRAEAIRIYEKLCLLYPEKSAYFTARINKIKEE